MRTLYTILFCTIVFPSSLLLAQNHQYYFNNINSNYSSSFDRIIKNGNGFAAFGTSSLSGGTFPFLLLLDSSLKISSTRNYINGDYQVEKDGADADSTIYAQLFAERILKMNKGFLLSSYIDSSISIRYSNGVIYGSNVVTRSAVAQLDKKGNVIWAKKFGGTQGFTLAISNVFPQENNFYAFGTVQQDNTLTYDFCMLKLDASGNLIWSKKIGGSGDDELQGAIQTSDGNFVLIGESYSFSAHRSVYIMKIDNNGSVMWSDAFNLSAFDYSSDVLELPGGELLVSASMTGSRSGLMLIKLGADGHLIWNKTLGSSTFDEPIALSQLGSSKIVLSGILANFSDNDMLLFICDTAGNVISSQRIGEAVKIIQGLPFTSDEEDFDLLVSKKKIYLPGTKLYIYEPSGGPPIVYEKSFLVTADENGSTDCLENIYPTYNDALTLNSYVATTTVQSADCFVLDYDLKAQDTVFSRYNACSPFNTRASVERNNFSLNIFPNPADDQIHLELPDAVKVQSISIVNLFGEIVEQFDRPANGELDLKKFPEGLYFLKIQTDSGVQTEPFVIKAIKNKMV